MCFSSIASFVSSAVLFTIGVLGLMFNWGPLPTDNYYVQRFWNNLFMEKFSKDFALMSTYKSDSRFWWFFLLTPILFAVQQLSEGFVWQRLINTSTPSAAAYIFSFFAFCFWPLWVPFICLVLESRWYSSYNCAKQSESYVISCCARLALSKYHSWVGRILVLLSFQIIGILLFCYMIASLAESNFSVSQCSDHVVYHFHTLPLEHKGPFFVTIPYLLCTVVPFSLVSNTSYAWTLSVSVGGSAIISFALYSAQTFPSTWCFFSAWISILTVFVRYYDLLGFQRNTVVFAESAVLDVDSKELCELAEM